MGGSNAQVYILTELITGGELHGAIREIPTVLSRHFSVQASHEDLFLWHIIKHDITFKSNNMLFQGSDSRSRHEQLIKMSQNHEDFYKITGFSTAFCLARVQAQFYTGCLIIVLEVRSAPLEPTSRFEWYLSHILEHNGVDTFPTKPSANPVCGTLGRRISKICFLKYCLSLF